MKLININIEIPLSSDVDGKLITIKSTIADLLSIDLKQKIVICDLYEGMKSTFEKIIIGDIETEREVNSEVYNLISHNVTYKFDEAPFKVTQELMDEFYPPVVERTEEEIKADELASIEEQLTALLAQKEALIVEGK